MVEARNVLNTLPHTMKLEKEVNSNNTFSVDGHSYNLTKTLEIHSSCCSLILHGKVVLCTDKLVPYLTVKICQVLSVLINKMHDDIGH